VRTEPQPLALDRQKSRTPAAASSSAQQQADSPASVGSGGHDFARVRVHSAPRAIQAKLRVNHPGDVHEREAEGIATALTGSIGPAAESVPDGERPAAARADVNDVPTGGSPLPERIRNQVEPGIGYDFGGVRIHTDSRAAESAAALGARAYTLGSDVVFGAGSYAPETSEGRWLIAHELTHVAQQGAAVEQSQRSNANRESALSAAEPGIAQRGFFSSLWEGIKSVGRAIGSAVEWVANRVGDAMMWVVDLVRDLPQRLARFAIELARGLTGVLSFIPEMINALVTGGIRGLGDFMVERAKAGGAWIYRMFSATFDLLGGPEAVEFIQHIISKATPLKSEEVAAAKSVLGENALRWDDVRVAEGGYLAIVFALNEGRAFTTYHTINIPATGEHSRTNLAIMVHELTHVYQYEKVGSVYQGEAIHAQATAGYDYSYVSGSVRSYHSEALKKHRADGKHMRDFNREQQAQIAQDYYDQMRTKGKAEQVAADPTVDAATREENENRAASIDLSGFAPFIAELQAGDI
jgi:hypothetical protein